jgi:hypothetical protein
MLEQYIDYLLLPVCDYMIWRCLAVGVRRVKESSHPFTQHVRGLGEVREARCSSSSAKIDEHP